MALDVPRFSESVIGCGVENFLEAYADRGDDLVEYLRIDLMGNFLGKNIDVAQWQDWLSALWSANGWDWEGKLLEGREVEVRESGRGLVGTYRPGLEENTEVLKIAPGVAKGSINGRFTELAGLTILSAFVNWEYWNGQSKPSLVARAARDISLGAADPWIMQRWTAFYSKAERSVHRLSGSFTTIRAHGCTCRPNGCHYGWFARGRSESGGDRYRHG